VKRRVVVTIAGQEFALLTEEEEAFVHLVAERVDEEIMALAKNMRASSAHIAIMSAINLAEESLRAQEASDHLREQIKGCLEESAKIKSENADLRREITKLKKSINNPKSDFDTKTAESQ
jgi:cell division protein ZapA